MEKDILDNTELLGQICHLDDGRLFIILPNDKQGFSDQKTVSEIHDIYARFNQQQSKEGYIKGHGDVHIYVGQSLGYTKQNIFNDTIHRTVILLEAELYGMKVTTVLEAKDD